jgi:hypothetical protein
MTTNESTFAFGPRPNRGYLGLSKVQIGSAISTATAAVVAMYVVGGVLGLPVGLAILALGALVTFTTRAGFPLLAWIPVVARSLFRERVWLHSGPTTQGTALALPKSLGKIDAVAGQDRRPRGPRLRLARRRGRGRPDRRNRPDLLWPRRLWVARYRDEWVGHHAGQPCRAWELG